MKTPIAQFPTATPTVKMVVLEWPAGTAAGEAILHAIQIANGDWMASGPCQVAFNFNGRLVTVKPGDQVQSILLSEFPELFRRD